MLTDFPNLARLFVLLVLALSLIMSLVYCFRKQCPPYLRVFPVYCFVSFSVEMLVNIYFYGARGPGVTYLTLYNLFTVFELSLFSWFLYHVIRSRRMRQVMILLLLLYGWFFIQYTRANDINRHLNKPAIVLESILLIIPCLVFFRELFIRPEPVDLLQEPSFWMVTGILFYFGSIFPYFLSMQYLETHGMITISRTLYTINNFSLAITHLLFIKGYTCRTRKS